MVAFGLLDVFWSMLWFFLFVMWIILIIRVFSDIFRSDDLGGFAKVLWICFVIFLPLLGVLIYIMTRGASMTERALQDAQQQQEAFGTNVRQTAGTSGIADELAKLNDLRASGAITAEDFEAAKAKILS